MRATTLQKDRWSGFRSITSAVLSSHALQNCVLIFPQVLGDEINRLHGTWKCSYWQSVFWKGCIWSIFASRAFSLRFCPRCFFMFHINTYFVNFLYIILFYHQFRLCITKAQGLSPYPYSCFALIVFSEEINIRRIAPQSFWIALYEVCSIHPVSNNSSSQYSVS